MLSNGIAALADHAPNRAIAVLGKDQRAILSLGDPDRPAPDVRIVEDKAGNEIFVFAGRRTLLHNYADDLVAGWFGSIPGAVLCGENITPIFRRELLACIKHHL